MVEAIHACHNFQLVILCIKSVSWTLYAVYNLLSFILSFVYNFFLFQVVDKHSSKFIREHLPSLLDDFKSLTTLEAQNLVTVSLCHETTISYNMHLYRMSKETQHAKLHSSSSSPAKHCNNSKHSSNSQSRNECLQCTSLYIGIGARGIETFEVHMWHLQLYNQYLAESSM